MIEIKIGDNIYTALHKATRVNDVENKGWIAAIDVTLKGSSQKRQRYYLTKEELDRIKKIEGYEALYNPGAVFYPTVGGPDDFYIPEIA